ncbi:hypothetical protein BC834DRAFT_841781 [Gloeopeniophorella convolvens]|nr:hypothetical protein BC834DRAFT_841781 [Gloeopeniophorella convolvens]
MTDSALLDILNAHGQQFLHSFGLPEPSGRKKRHAQEDSNAGRRPAKLVKLDPDESDEEDEEDWADSAEEWTGIGRDISTEDGSEENGAAIPSEARGPRPKPDVIVFSDIGKVSAQASSSKLQAKTFMSSKVSKLKAQDQERKESDEANDDGSDGGEDER